MQCSHSTKLTEHQKGVKIFLGPLHTTSALRLGICVKQFRRAVSLIVSRNAWPVSEMVRYSDACKAAGSRLR